MTDQERMLKAIEQCFQVSDAPPTSGDIAAVVLHAAADIVAPKDFTYDTGSLADGAIEFEQGQEARNEVIRYRLLELAEAMNGTDYSDAENTLADANRYRWIKDQKNLILQTDSQLGDPWTNVETGYQYRPSHRLAVNGTGFSGIEHLDDMIDQAMELYPLKH